MSGSSETEFAGTGRARDRRDAFGFLRGQPGPWVLGPWVDVTIGTASSGGVPASLGRRPGPAGCYPFRAPAVSPRIRWRWRNVNSTATGTVLMMTPAESCPHWISYCPTM